MKVKFILFCLLALAGSVCICFTIQNHGYPAPKRPVGDHEGSPSTLSHTRAARKPLFLVKDGEGLGGLRLDAAAQIAFEPNVGQADASTEFIGRARGLTVLLVRDGFQLVIPNRARKTPNQTSAFPAPSTNAVVGIRLLPSPDLHWTGAEKLRGETNYFVGKDPRKWRKHISHFARTESQTSSGKASLAFYGKSEGFEYDLRVPPGMDIRKLRLALTGATQTHLDSSGDLLMNVSGTEIRMRKPTIYEEGARPNQPQAATETPPALHKRPAAKRPPGARKRTTVPVGPKKKRRRRTPASIQRAQRHRERKKMRGSNARPPAMRPPRKNPPQKPKRPSNVDRPKATSYGNHKGKRVEGGYVLEADGTVGFRIGPHDPHATLVLDPSISIVYSSFLGGAGNDSANSLAMDSSGNLYVGGTTTSAATFPESGSTSIGSTGGAADLFIAKIDPSKSGADSLVYLTFLGGSGNENGGLVAVDSKGNAAIAGTTTSPDFPVTDGSKLGSGPNAATVTEIDPTGSTLVYSTIFGGNGAEAAQGSGGIAFDGSGNIFVATDTSSTNLPVTTGAFQQSYGGGISDGFLAIFKPAAAPHLKYCTYFGINAQAAVAGIAVDVAGNAYISGFTTNPGTSFPVKNAFQSTYAGDPDDSFLMKILPGGNGAQDLIYATLLGGGDLDEAYAVAVDTASPPNAYVTGTTQSTNFPTSGVVAGYASSLHADAIANAFLAVVSQNATTNATSLAYSTYLGGSEMDSGESIFVTAANSVYVTGSTTSFDFPWLNNLQPYNGDGDTFIAKLDPTSAGSASLIYSTPLGGTAPPGGTVTAAGQGIAAASSSGVTSVFIAGQTTAADFPTSGSPGNGFQLVCGSCQESPTASNGFVVQIQESAALQPSVYFSAPNLNFGLQPVAATNIPPQAAAVYNGGESALQISDIGIAGPNGADFSVINPIPCESAPINPGEFCSLGVGFIPSMVGPEAASLSFSTNAPGNPQVLELLGIGKGPIATISPLSFSFGNQPVGSTSSGLTVSLTNSGNDELTFVSVSVNGSNATAFPAIQNQFTCGVLPTIEVGGYCSFVVFFDPTSTGTFAAEIDFIDNSGGLSGSEQIVQLTGVGVPAGPIVNLQPSELQFGTLAVGSTSSVQSVQLSNTGSTGLNLTSIAVTGSNEADFGIATTGANPCPMPNGTVVSGTSCTIGVFFTPHTGGAKSASLSFTDDASGSPQSVSLSGTATAPSLQISPASLSFNSQSEGITGPPQVVTITNAGTTPLAINSITVAGANSGDFTETNNCPPSIGGSLNCVVNVSFKPTATGSRTASLTIADNASGSPQAISLAGTGTQAAVSLSPASISFGNQLSGVTSAPVTISLTNTGTGSLAVTAAATSGTNASDFSISANSCMGTNASTAPNATCTLQVTFAPACSNSAAARTATLSLTDNAPDSPQTISLSGTATGNFCIVASAGSLSANVASGATANYSLNLQAANGFAGSVVLTLAQCPPFAVCTVTPPSAMVAGAMQTPFHVTVATQSNLAASHRPSGPIGNRLPSGERRFLPSKSVRANVEWVLVALLAFVAASLKIKHPARRFVQVATLAVVLAIAIAACGGGSSGGGGGGGDPATPAGTYMITLTGTANNTPQTTTLTLVVE